MARATPRQQAANIKRAEKSIAASIEKEIKKKLARGIQEFAVRSMNGLAQAGPAWTGEFSQSWVFVPYGESASSLSAGGKIGIGKYSKQDVTIYEIQRHLKSGKDKFQIVNTSEHAAIAIDAQTAKFASPSYQIDPIKEPVDYGTGRPSADHFRWQIRNAAGEDITSQITAERDWFINYLEGGQLQQDLADGVRLGFSGN